MSGLFATLAQRFGGQAWAAVLPSPRQRFEDAAGFETEVREVAAPPPRLQPAEHPRAVAPAAAGVVAVAAPALRTAPTGALDVDRRIERPRRQDPVDPVAPQRPAVAPAPVDGAVTGSHPAQLPLQEMRPELASPGPVAKSVATPPPMTALPDAPRDPVLRVPARLADRTAEAAILPVRAALPASERVTQATPVAVDARVEIRIGRVEVSTPTAPAAPRAAPAKPVVALRPVRPASGLTDYLGWRR